METKTGIILAAGKGKRLDSQNTIKPLVHVGGKALIDWNIGYMEEIGIKHIYIVIGCKGKLVKNYILSNDYNGIKFEFINNPNWEDGILSSLLSLDHFISNDSIFLSPCDTFFEKSPYKYFLKEDLKYNGIVSLISQYNNHANNSGANLIIKDANHEKIFPSELSEEYDGISTGIYYFNNKMLSKSIQFAKKNKKISNFFELINYLSNKKLLKLRYFENCEWFDINTPAVRIRTEMFLRKNSVSINIDSKNKLMEKPFNTFTTKKEVKTDIFVRTGCLNNIDQFDLIPESHSQSPHFIIMDENIETLFGDNIFRKIKSSGYNIKKIVLPPGEKTKSLYYYSILTEKLISEGIDEKTILISLGGGIINNITGFLASTLYRGIYLIHIPTTLMAQSDAAIGIKQAVDGDKGKNLIGSYFEPMKIIVDPSVLLNSNINWLRDGLAECIKHAIAQSPEFYKYFIDYKGKIKDLEFLDFVVKNNIELKTKLMTDDPKEKREALVLQYGHTVGHAVEYLSGYKLGHGESVAIGMVAAAQISETLGICDKELVNSHRRVLKKYKLPITIPANIKIDDILIALRYNKRYLYDDVQFVLLNAIGSLWDYKGDYSIPCDNNIIKQSLKSCYD